MVASPLAPPIHPTGNHLDLSIQTQVSSTSTAPIMFQIIISSEGYTLVVISDELC